MWKWTEKCRKLSLRGFLSHSVTNFKTALYLRDLRNQQISGRCQSFYQSFFPPHENFYQNIYVNVATSFFFPSTGETQIYRPQPKLMAATQEVPPKPRTSRDIRFYLSKPSLNYISKNLTSTIHFPMINPMINKNENDSEETSVIT